MDTALNIAMRPDSFDDIIGNRTTVKGLKKLVKVGKVKTYLLTGPRGCGKTTIARILAGSLGAKSRRDIIELDLAEVGLKDTGRELKVKAKYRSLSGGSKVYLFDECQESSTGFQQSILKLIEEPPAKTYFIFCTTNPEKMIKTVRSRCSTWPVNLLKGDEAVEFMDVAIKKTGIDISPKHKRMIIEVSEGCPREMLILMEQVSAVKDDISKVEVIRGYAANETFEGREIAAALLKGADWKTVAALIKSMKDTPETARRTVVGYMATVLLNSGQQRAADIIEFFKEPYYDTSRPAFIQACYYATKI